jgi:hypothetical protein
MQLQYGKRYRSYSGQITGPLFKTPEPIPGGQSFSGYFLDETGDDECCRTWSPNGSTSGTDYYYDRDLLEEIAE